MGDAVLHSEISLHTTFTIDLPEQHERRAAVRLAVLEGLDEGLVRGDDLVQHVY